MAKVIWSPGAQADLEAITAYIARDSSRQAALFVQRIRRAVTRLTLFPHSGRIVPEIGRDAVREIIFERYRIVYQLADGDVEIMMLQHAARPL